MRAHASVSVGCMEAAEDRELIGVDTMLRLDHETPPQTPFPKLTAPEAPLVSSLQVRKNFGSVVKLFVVKTEPNYAQPWQMRPQRSATGSGFVISGRRIITTAHVVACSTTVHVRKPGSAKKYPGKVISIGHICDLALLSVADENFWDGLVPLEFAPVPHLQDIVVVVGYPRGGDSISVTKGVVSRVDMKRYGHGGNRLIAIQIDAAINPGNSGGPAFCDLQTGKVAGVAFSKLTEADNIGYIIPHQIIEHFLAENERYGQFRGVCSLGFRWEDMENPYLRESLQVSSQQSGVLVYKTDPLAPCAAHLKERDVIMSVDGTAVADDGTIELRNEERVEFSHVIRSHFIGDVIRVVVWRDGQEVELSYPLAPRRPLVPIMHSVDCVPSYFVFGGLVFVPLSVPFIEHAFGHSWRKVAPVPLLSLIPEYRTKPEEQVVILFQVLSAEINFGYKVMPTKVLSCSGQSFENLRDLAAIVDKWTGKYIEFMLDGGKMIILNTEVAREAGPEILKQHAISSDRSPDLTKAAAKVGVLEGSSTTPT
eukprot:jgi/Mesvir1/5897/Mv00669-RA.1